MIHAMQQFPEASCALWSFRSEHYVDVTSERMLELGGMECSLVLVWIVLRRVCAASMRMGNV